MAKNLKFTIKNSQIAAAVNLSGLSEALQKKQEEPVTQAAPASAAPAPPVAPQTSSRGGAKKRQEASPAAEVKEERPRVRARARSAFSESTSPQHEGVLEESAIGDQPTQKAADERESSVLAETSGSLKVRQEGFTPSDLERALPPLSKAGTQEAPGQRESEPAILATVSDTRPKNPEKADLTPASESKQQPASPLSSAVEEPLQEQPSAHAAVKAQNGVHTPPSSLNSPAQAPSSGAHFTSTAPRERTSSHSQGPFKARPAHHGEAPRAGLSRPPPRGQTDDRYAQRQRGPYSTPPSPSARAPASESQTPRPLVRNPSLFSAGKTPPVAIGGGPAREKLGPTGKHVRDLMPARPARPAPSSRGSAPIRGRETREEGVKGAARAQPAAPKSAEEDARKGSKPNRLKEFQDVKPVKKGPSRSFDARDRQGLRSSEEDSVWRKRRNKMSKPVESATTVRPTSLHVRLPISVKDLAAEMKIKASQVIEKIFLQGMVRTINDFLDDATLVELVGHELGCEIIIDTTEEDRIRITGQTVREEVAGADAQKLIVRPPIVAFMGHVDHGKTSLIDAIRKSNRVAGEAGAITQHIGAFQCKTAVGNITVLDTPGHEAFSAMRARGADVTDIVVLVVAGDEGIRQQTIEAIEHAKLAKVTIVVAINKCDKPNFNADNVYRQLAEHDLLPEAWGGSILTINCSATTGAGISELLEMLALQSEVLELRANPTERARGRVIESEMHKGMGSTATILVQNGTLRKGDALVFDQHWGRVKTMRNDLGQAILEALPAAPVEITGLSGLPEAGQEFIVVASEREAREIAEKRMLGFQQNRMQQAKRLSLESLTEQATDSERKILYLVLRADVQGSLEALQTSLKKILSKKVAIHVISAGVGEISESDVQLAAMSKGVIIGFHTGVESHAESMIRQTGVQVHLHDIIYHAVDDVKELMSALLDRIAVETEKGKAEILEIFHSSHMGLIAGCRVTEGSIMRQYPLRLRRGKDVVWQGTLSSLKRGKEDAREVQKGIECGMVLQGCKDIQKGDIIEAYEVSYITQEL